MRARIPGDGEEIDVSRADAAELETGADGLIGEPRAVLDAAEALFLDRRDELSVAHERGRDVAVVGVEPEDVHSARAGTRASRTAVNRSRKRASVKSRRNRVRPRAPIRSAATRSPSSRTTPEVSCPRSAGSTSRPDTPSSTISAAAPRDAMQARPARIASTNTKPNPSSL